jgi:SulP family sulfate permease
MGATGLGTAVKFIPRPVTIGFTNGIAILIASTQIRDFLGLNAGVVPSEFIGRMRVLSEHLSSIDPRTAAVACCSLAIIVLWPFITKRIPGSIVALLVGTLAVVVLKLPVDTIGSKFGGIPTGLPLFQIPTFRADLIPPLLPSALTVALARGGRKFTFSRSGRRNEPRQAQFQRRVDGSRDRQHRNSAVRWDTRHWRDCPHRDQHPVGR